MRAREYVGGRFARSLRRLLLRFLGGSYSDRILSDRKQ